MEVFSKSYDNLCISSKTNQKRSNGSNFKNFSCENTGERQTFILFLDEKLPVSVQPFSVLAVFESLFVSRINDIQGLSVDYVHFSIIMALLFWHGGLMSSRVDPLTSILARSYQILTTSWRPWNPWQDS